MLKNPIRLFKQYQCLSFISFQHSNDDHLLAFNIVMMIIY